MRFFMQLSPTDFNEMPFNELGVFNAETQRAGEWVDGEFLYQLIKLI